MFMHANWGHLFSNMLLLFIGGPWLERVWGPTRFLVYYLICGVGAALLFTLINTIDINSIDNKLSRYRLDPNPDSYELITHRQFKSFVENNPDAEAFSTFPRKFEENPDNPELKKESVIILDYLLKAIINIPMVGASGAVFGILIGMGLLFPNTVVILLFPPIPIKIKYLVGFMAIMELYGGVYRPTDSVAHFAHIGGMIVGYLIIVYWRRKRDRFY
jgi:membrane associated rhomboid family serine protease